MSDNFRDPFELTNHLYADEDRRSQLREDLEPGANALPRTEREPEQPAAAASPWERMKNAAGGNLPADYGAGTVGAAGSGSPYMLTSAQLRAREAALENPLDSDPSEGPGGLAGAAGGAVRFLASALEPLQLPQDVFFATIEAGMDNEKSLLENLKEVEWAKYAPFGHAPARVTDGETILELAGVQDEGTRKWGGIAMDLVVDPLIFGSVARVAGKASKIDGLVNLGDRMDQAVAPGFWARSVYKRSPAVRGAADKLTDTVLTAIRNPDARLLGIRSKYWNAAVEGTIARRTASRIKLGGLAPEGRALGRDEDLPTEFIRSEQMGAQYAEDVIQDAVLEVGEIRKLMGFEDLAQNKVRRILQALGMIRREEQTMGSVPTIVREAAMREAYDFLDNNPAALMKSSGFTDDVRNMLSKDMPEGGFRPEFELGTDLPSGSRLRADEFAPDGSPNLNNVLGKGVANFEESVDRVRQIAVKNGYAEGADEYVRAYREAVGRMAALNAKIGYELSGMSMIREIVMRRGVELFGSTDQASKLWQQVLRAGVSEGGLSRWLRSDSGLGPNDSSILTARGRRQAADRARTRERAYEANLRRGKTPEEAEAVAERAVNRLPEPEVDPARARARDRLGDERAEAESFYRGAGPRNNPERDFKWEDLLGDEWGGFSALDVGTYLSGLRNGHMYRAFGIWQTQDQFRDWARMMDEGKIIPNNIIDETRLTQDFADADLADEGRMIQDYIEAVQGRSGAKRGTILNTRKMAQHVAERLRDTGMSTEAAHRRAQAAIDHLAATTRGRRLERANEVRREVAPAFEAQDPLRGTPLLQGRFSERTDFSREQLDILGEMADPLISIMEDANALKRRMPVMQFMRSVYDEGVRSGAVRRKPFTDPKTGVVFQHVKNGVELAGPFDGKYVHPQLMEEIRKAGARRDFTPSRLGHLRSLITGGYLASPSVLTANLAGGLLSTWEAGIPPHLMLRAMAESFRPLHKDGGRGFAPFDELRMREATQLHDVSLQDVERNFRDFKISEASLQPGGLRGAFQEIEEFYRYILKGGPRATQWAGLSGFQFTEKWLKTSAYLAASKYMKRPLNEAAELGRTAVFDYSELPESLRWARDAGFLLFPGFPYFMTSRTIRAVVERPGVPALADRVSEAMGNAFMDDEERLAAWANMPDWLREAQGVPIGRWTDAKGHDRIRFIPMNQLLPTETFAGNPFAESLSTGGIWRPFLEALYAHVEGSGEAAFSARYGQRVFEPQQTIPERMQATMSFMFNNLAPSSLRKLYSPTPGEPPTGLLPSLTMPADVVRGIYTFDEVMNTRAERGLKDSVIASLLRAPRVIAMEGPLRGLRNEYDRAARDHSAKISAMQKDYDRARGRQDRQEMERIADRMREEDRRFKEQWREFRRLANEPDWD